MASYFNNMRILNGILLPLWGTILGAFFVFLIRTQKSSKLNALILPFTAGIMLSSAIFSLLIPSLEQKSNIIFVITGFMVGIISLKLLTNKYPDTSVYQHKIMILSIILHNIPEGIAVGVAMSAVLNNQMPYHLAIILSIGIAIQNIPEGLIVSIPWYQETNNKISSFLLGCFSGIVEPISALLSFFIINKIIILLPFILAFASAAMIYVVVEQIIPSSPKNKISISFSIGFLLMIVLEYLI